MFCRSVVLKPLNSTRTLYAPGVRFGALYAPDSSVVRGREVPLWTSRMVTVAPVTAPPLASITVPTMRPLLPCENAETQSRSIPSVAPNTCSTFFDFERTADLMIDSDEFITSHPFSPEFTLRARQNKQSPHPNSVAQNARLRTLQPSAKLFVIAERNFPPQKHPQNKFQSDLVFAHSDEIVHVSR